MFREFKRMGVWQAPPSRKGWRQIFYGVATASVLTVGAGTVTASPILEYHFDETGTSALSSGTDASPLFFTSSPGQSADLHGPLGSGVTAGLNLPTSSIDRAFDNTASTAMGSLGTGGMAAHAGDDNAIDGLMSYSLSGWFKAQDTSQPNNARLFQNTSDELNVRHGYHAILGNVTGEVRIATDATEKTYSPAPIGPTWVFLAFTYDGTITKGNAKTYIGYRNNTEAPNGSPSVVLVADKNIAEGPSDNDTGTLQIGNEGFAYSRPFDGWMDNLRIDGSTLDASGALSLAALENRRLGDLSLPEIVPEPITGGIVLFALATLTRPRPSFRSK